jgi:shikimate kinase
MTLAFDGHIVLVGPIGVGKTPVAEMVAERLSIERVELDLAEEYRRQVGWNEKEAWRLAEEGYVARFEYEAQFSVPLIERLMEEYPSAIFDCGGLDLVGWTDEQRDEIKDGLTVLGLKHIAAILPFSDIDKCRSYYASHYASRDASRYATWNFIRAMNESLIENPSYKQIANEVFYTEDRELEPVGSAIIDWVLGSRT